MGSRGPSPLPRTPPIRPRVPPRPAAHRAPRAQRLHRRARRRRRGPNRLPPQRRRDPPRRRPTRRRTTATRLQPPRRRSPARRLGHRRNRRGRQDHTGRRSRRQTTKSDKVDKVDKVDKAMATTRRPLPRTTWRRSPAPRPMPGRPCAATVSTLSSVSTANSVEVKPNSSAKLQKATPTAAPPPPNVATILTSALNEVLNPFAGNAPAAPAPPVDPPAAWVLLAAARREFSDAAVSLAPTSPITVNPTLVLRRRDHLRQRQCDGRQRTAAHLHRRVRSQPGRKDHLRPRGGPGTFSYLPYETVLTSGTEQFSVLVNETTPFETALDASAFGGLSSCSRSLVLAVPSAGPEPLPGRRSSAPRSSCRSPPILLRSSPPAHRPRSRSR